MSVAIRKLGKAAKKRLKRYRQAEDSFVFHTGNNDPADFVNPPKMPLGIAQEYLTSGGKNTWTMFPNKRKTRKKRKKGRGSLPLRK